MGEYLNTIFELQRVIPKEAKVEADLLFECDQELFYLSPMISLSIESYCEGKFLRMLFDLINELNSKKFFLF